MLKSIQTRNKSYKHLKIKKALEIIDRTVTIMDNNETPINTVLDISDTLYHGMLLNKLNYCGITGIALNLIKSYNSNRS